MDGAREAMSSAGDSVAAAEVRVSRAMDLSGSEPLIVGGAALFLIIGEILFGELLGSTTSGFTLGGISLSGVLAGEVLLFIGVFDPRPGRPTLISANTVKVVVAALVVAIVLYTFSDFVTTLRNLSGFTSTGIFSILGALARWAGAVLMGLGVVSAWMGTMTVPKAAARK
jgi:hypothetical protein